MKLPESLFVIWCMVRDTFRQSLASRTFWLTVALIGLCILLCLSVRLVGFTATTPAGEIERVTPSGAPFIGQTNQRGYMEVAFGLIRVDMPRDAADMTSYLHELLALYLGGVIGMLLIVLWTSGFLPEFLDPRSAALLLAKPVPRWALLLGKYVGVVCFVILQICFFVLGTWAALGIRSGYWHPAYLLTIPSLVLEFAILYSFSTLLAVWTRSTVICLFGTLLLWGSCAAVSAARLAPRDPESKPGSSARVLAVEASYWILPKPADPMLMLGDFLNEVRNPPPPPGDPTFATRSWAVWAWAGPRRTVADCCFIARVASVPPGTEPKVPTGRVAQAELSFVTSLLFSAGVLGLASWRFVTREY
jgi:ABC-type transport system involved in multi-copper enzyme maturation permease subunit